MKATHLFLLVFIGNFFISSVVPPHSLNEDMTNFPLITQNSITSVEEQDTLRILSFDYGSTGNLQIFDSLTMYNYLASMVFDSLVDFSFDSRKISPSLAESWVVSLDSRDWTFFLRNDILFHDGTPFNAYAVKFSYDRLINTSHPAYIDPLDLLPEFQSLPLASVEIKSTFTVTFHFKEPYAPFIYNEAPFIGIYSPASFLGPNISTPIGTGPYQYVDSEDEYSTFFLTRNSDHHWGIAPFKNITYRIFDDYSTYSEAVQNHEADIGTSAKALLYLPEDDNYWELSAGFSGIELGWFNHSNPILANPKVRAAINHAIDKEDYTDQTPMLYGVGSITSLIFSDSIFHDKKVPGYPFNLDLAKSLLDEAGYPRGSDGYRFSLNLTGPAWNENISNNRNRVNYTRNQLTKLGINTTVSFISMDEWLNGEAAWDVFIVGWGGIADPSFCREFLHTSGSLNLGGFSNSYLDNLLSMAQYTPIEQERKYYYSKIQWLSQDMVPYLLLQEVKKPYIRAKEVTSLVEMNINGEFSFAFKKQDKQVLLSMDNVPITVNPLYFQLADLVISPPTLLHDSTISLVLAHNLQNILPEIEETGKFYSISSSEQEFTTYNVLFYFDEEDFNSSIDLEKINLYIWDEESQTWEETEPVSINPDFQYIEVSLNLTTDPLIFSLGFDILLDVAVTFQYLFPYLVLIGTILSLGTAVIILNRIFANNLKEELLLP